MTTFTQKALIAATLVVGMALSAGALDTSANAQQTNHFTRGDAGSSTTVMATVESKPAHQSRYRIGFLDE